LSTSSSTRTRARANGAYGDGFSESRSCSSSGNSFTESRSCSSSSSVCTARCLIEKVGELCTWVDSEDHTRLAMRSLSAIEPLRLVVGDSEVEDFLPRNAIWVGSETGLDAGGVENAWVVEGGLCDGVVPLAEVEVDYVSDVGNDALGSVLEEGVRASDYDSMGLGRGGGRSL